MITIDKWAGLVTNASPYAIANGAAVTQVNMQCLAPGSLTVRSGVTQHATCGGSVVQMVRMDSTTEQRVAAVSYDGVVTLVNI
jgi:hypothetical protein